MSDLLTKNKRLLLLGLALACFWPTMHNELMYPVSIIYRNTGSLASYPLHILYLVVILATSGALIRLRKRTTGSQRLFRTLCLLSGACGAAGGIAIATARPGVSIPADLLAGVGTALFAIYFAMFFMLAFAALCQTDTHLILPCIFFSYACFCAMRFAAMGLGLLDGNAVQSASVALLPAASSLVLLSVGQPCGMTAHSLREVARVMPWQTLAPGLALIYLATAGIALFNLAASWAELPATRSIIYLLNLFVCAVAGIVTLKCAHSKWLTLGVLSALAVYLVAAVRLSVVVSANEALNFGTSPLLAAKLALEVFLLGACAKACNPARRNAAPPRAVAFGYLLFVIVLPDFVSIDFLLSDRYVDALPSTTTVFSIAGVIPVIVAAIIVAILLHQLARANDVIGIQKEKRGRATAEELQQAIARELDLSPREAEVTYLLCRGQGAKAIGEQMFVSESTVYAHMKRIYRKLGLHSKQELVDLVAEKVGPVV